MQRCARMQACPFLSRTENLQQAFTRSIMSSAHVNQHGHRRPRLMQQEVTLGVTGTGAFGMLKHESGVHRVQRVPSTEAAGRIHTSTATVAVLPEPTELDVVIHERDIKMEAFKAGGAGGQHVNTTDSAVRLTHEPSGVVVACQTERSQHKNRAAAMKILKARVFAMERQKAEEERRKARQDLISTNPGSRSDRIRTYNYPQDRVTDHRVKMTLNNLEGVMQGEGLMDLSIALQQYDNMDKLAQLLEQHKSS
eukprot:TRINITY_DN9356_c0_g1_i5.p2 TRINITY_DN9356_c0_g1~~TRINITY_DN9356_c0_g1_i5.p2  ORF type:complete len:252 (+),score=52.19 TRINITY_DN9356_c0_g1_i5:757-1512(+)